MSAWEHKLTIQGMKFWEANSWTPNWAWYVSCSCYRGEYGFADWVHKGEDGYFGRKTWLAAFTLGMAHQIEQIVKETHG